MLRTDAGNGGPPRCPQASRQRNFGPARLQRHVHGKAGCDPGRFQFASPREPVAGRKRRVDQCFPGEGNLAGIAGSDGFRWFLGRWMRYAPESMACYAPTASSYKRFQAGSWAPTVLPWSPDNPATELRIVGAGPSLRIEGRIPGADVNPHLACEAVVASGLADIAQRIEPPRRIWEMCTRRRKRRCCPEVLKRLPRISNAANLLAPRSATTSLTITFISSPPRQTPAGARLQIGWSFSID